MHRPRKRFSQNFLVDDSVVRDIVAAISPRACDRMLEIGPGLEALTRPLAAVVRPLHVVEIDRDIVARLKHAYPPERLVVHEGDALEFDFTRLGAPLRVVGNLPYHISTPLLFHLAGALRVLEDVHAMLQAEVVERMIAPAGSPQYGRLSVMLQYRFDMEKVLDVPASAFRPAPKVESAVVRMLPKSAGALRALDDEVLADTVSLAFAQRRKTLRNTLGHVLNARDFVSLGIDSQARAQTLTLDEFIRIADHRTRTNAEKAR